MGSRFYPDNNALVVLYNRKNYFTHCNLLYKQIHHHLAHKASHHKLRYLINLCKNHDIEKNAHIHHPEK